MNKERIISEIAGMSSKYNKVIDRVILFGSYAKGSNTDCSDLDIYIESDTITKSQMLHSKDISDFRLSLFALFDGKDIDFVLNSPLSREYKTFVNSSLYKQITEYGVVVYDKRAEAI